MAQIHRPKMFKCELKPDCLVLPICCVIMWTIIISLILVSYLENIQYQKDHNGNKQDLSAFCAILGYLCNNVQLRIIVLYIAE